MAWKLDDRWIWLGFGAFLFVAAKGISYGLKDTLRLTRIHDVAYQPTHTRDDDDIKAEDSISLEALRTLAFSPNPDIANAATSLLTSRFASSPRLTTSLTVSLFSASPTTRTRTRHLLALFDTHPLPPDHAAQHPFNLAFVRALRDAKSTDLRTMHMLLAFYRAFGRAQRGVGSYAAIVDAVGSVLFEEDDDDDSGDDGEGGGTRPRPRPRVTTRVTTRVTSLPGPGGGGPLVEEIDLEELLDQVTGTTTRVAAWDARESVEQLMARSRAIRVSADELRAALLDEVRGAESGGAGRGVGRRVQEESPEEVEVRRRRREAMVLFDGEGGGAPRREDIFNPPID